MTTIVNLIVAAVIVLPTHAYAQSKHTPSSQSFYDRNGSFAGSSSTHGNSTTFTDRSGKFDGTVIRNSDGTTSSYDRNGRFVGSSSNTSQPR